MKNGARDSVPVATDDLPSTFILGTMDGQQANGADFMVQSQTASPPGGGGGGGGGSNGDAAAAAAAGAGTGAAAANAATANGGINNNSEAKRAKLDTMKQNNPSRVIHIRNIPNDVTEAEIIHLGIPFGRVTNVLVLKGKNQVGLFVPWWINTGLN